MTTILALRVGDAVRDSRGTRGVVVGFTKDHVAIEWSDCAGRYTDGDLKVLGVVKVSPFDAEDTVP